MARLPTLPVVLVLSLVAACAPNHLAPQASRASGALSLDGAPLEAAAWDLALGADGSVAIGWTDLDGLSFRTGWVEADGEVLEETILESDERFGTPGIALQDNEIRYMLGELVPSNPYAPDENDWRMVTDIPHATGTADRTLWGTSVRPEMTRSDDGVAASWTARVYPADLGDLFVLHTGNVVATRVSGFPNQFSGCSIGLSTQIVRDDGNSWGSDMYLHAAGLQHYLSGAEGRSAIACHPDGPRALVLDGEEEARVLPDGTIERVGTGLPDDGMGVVDVHTADGVDWVLKGDAQSHALYRRIEGGAWERNDLVDLPADASPLLDTRGEEALLSWRLGDHDIEWMVVDLGFLPPAPEGPRLDVSGSCPGTVDLSGSGFTPGGQVAVLTAPGPGATPLAAGPCAGQVTGLGAGLTFRGLFPASGDGTLALGPTMGARACGLDVELLDVASCELSNVGQVP